MADGSTVATTGVVVNGTSNGSNGAHVSVAVAREKVITIQDELRNLKEGQRRTDGMDDSNIPGGHHHIIQMDQHAAAAAAAAVAHAQMGGHGMHGHEDSRSRSDGEYSDGEGDELGDLPDSKSQSLDYSPRENRLISFADEHAKPLCEHFYYKDDPDPEPEPEPPVPRPTPVDTHNIPVKTRCLLTRGRAAKLAVFIVLAIVLAVLLFVFLR